MEEPAAICHSWRRSNWIEKEISLLMSLEQAVSHSSEEGRKGLPKWAPYVPLVASAVFLFVFLTTKRGGSGGHHDDSPAIGPAHLNDVILHPVEDTPHVEVRLSDRIYSGLILTVGNRKVHAFLGIRYAEPPVGNLRFRRPVPLGPPRSNGAMGTLVMARRKRFPCPQRQSWNMRSAPSLDVNVTEDCLHLNVWAPADSSRERRAVVVFLHGGGFQKGSNDQEANDGRVLSAEADVVVVAPNYRLNAFGFLNGHVPDAPGNMGLHDVILALRWVYQNVVHFGGSPGNITLVGRDAGAVLAGYVMVSPVVQGLVRRYILLSGSPFWNLPNNRGATSVLNLEALAKRLKCRPSESVLDAVRCLTRANIYSFIDLADVSQFSMYPSDQDQVLPFPIPTGLINSATYGPGDILLGNEATVGLSLVTPLLRVNLEGVLKRSLRSFGSRFLKRFGLEDAEEAMKEYDIAGAANKSLAFADLVADFVVRCPLQFLADELARRGRRVFYFILKNNPAWKGLIDQNLFLGMPLGNSSAPSDLVALSKSVVYTWTTFAKTGNLRLSNKKPWPLYTSQSHSFVVLGPGTEDVLSAYREHFCKVWRSRVLGA